MLPLVLTVTEFLHLIISFIIMDDITLISLVESCPHIYDRCDQNYKNMEEKRNTWEKIASTVGMTAQQVRRRWINLRDRYVKAHRHNEKMETVGGLRDCFPYYEKMTFLEQHTKRRKYEEVNNMGKNNPVPYYPSPRQRALRLKRRHENLASEENDIAVQKTDCNNCNSLSTIVKTFDKYVSTVANSSNGDTSFTKSVVDDMQLLNHKGKMLFKVEVYKLLNRLLEEYPEQP